MILRARMVFYKALVHAVLLYVSEIWVITDKIMKFLEGFHHLIYQRIASKTSQKVWLDGWQCPLVEEALDHRWGLPGNYPVFTVVMVIYHYVERIWRILVTPIF